MVLHRMSNDEIQKMLDGIEIPPQPEVLLEFNSEKSKEYPNIRKITDILAKDTAITAGILRTVNSSFFGLSQKVTSIAQAIPLLGLNNVSNLVFCVALKNALSKNKSLFLNKFWEKSNAIALLSAKIAKDFTVISSDEAYTLGMMCDCAVPLVAEKNSEYEDFYIKYDGNSEMTITQLENTNFTMDHAVIGAFLSRSWKLPPIISSGIEFHHTDQNDFTFKTDEENRYLPTLLAILLLAQHIYSRFLKKEACIEWKRRGNNALQTLCIDNETYEDIVNEYIELLENENEKGH